MRTVLLPLGCSQCAKRELLGVTRGRLQTATDQLGAHPQLPGRVRVDSGAASSQRHPTSECPSSCGCRRAPRYAGARLGRGPLRSDGVAANQQRQ